jgi:hypothetical protein
MSDLSLLPIDVADLQLSQKELLFVGEYCSNGFDEVDAAKKVGLIPKSASPTESRLKVLELVNHKGIKTAIQKFTTKVLEPYKDKLELMELQTLKARAFYSVDMFYNSDGSVKPLDQIPSEWRFAIDDISEDFKGKDANVRTVKYKLADRAQAQKALRELLRKVDDEGDVSEIPSDRRKFLQDLFVKGASAGANIAMEAFKRGFEEKKTEPQLAEKTPLKIAPDVPDTRLDIQSDRIKEALSRRKKNGEAS